jgi:hypothetical protein
MIKLNRAMRRACLAATLLMFLTPNASAELLLLVCNSQGPNPFPLRIDLTKRTATSSFGSQDLVGQADITDVMITIHLQSKRTGQWDHTDGRLDRVTGIYLVRFCDRSECTGVYTFNCQKGAQQF